MNRVSTGLADMDRVLDGGFPSRTAVLLCGAPGTGKTLLGLNFLLDGAAKGEKCFYLSVSESKDELLRACNGIESLKAVGKYLDKNLVFKTISLGEKIGLEGFSEMFDDMSSIDRLVIDNVNKLLIAADSKREYRIRLSKMLNNLRKKVGCSLLICEMTENNEAGHDEAFECDGVVKLSFLDLEEKPMRTVQVLKMRYTDFHPKVSHELAISKREIKLTQTKIV
jgi:circadian clock protein KaiC